jgi:hypothetical protein
MLYTYDTQGIVSISVVTLLVALEADGFHGKCCTLDMIYEAAPAPEACFPRNWDSLV